MKKILKSKWFIMSILCIITVAMGTTLSISDKLANKNTATRNDTNQKQVYGNFTIESSWVADPSEPKNLLKIIKDNAIIKVKIKSIGEAIFLNKTKNFNDPNPFTPIEVIVEKSLDEQPLPNINTVYLRGGDVKISDLMEKIDQETIQKMGFDTLTKKQQETMYVSYKSEHDYNLKPGEEYVLIVAKNSNNVYTIAANGYGIFKEAEGTTSEVTSKNVLTKKELTDRNGTVLKHKK